MTPQQRVRFKRRIVLVAARGGRLDAKCHRPPRFDPNEAAAPAAGAYLRAYEQQRRRMAHAKRVRAACTPASRTQALIREHREILCMLAADLEGVCPEAAADARRAASALFAAWSKLKGK